MTRLLLLGTREVSAHKPPRENIVMSPVVNPMVPINSDKDSGSIKEITGKIISSEYGEPVAFASISNYTTRVSVVSDETGTFKIAAGIGDSISIVYLGFEPYTFRVKNQDFKEYKLKSKGYQLQGDVIIVRSTKAQIVKSKIWHFFHIKKSHDGKC